MLVLVAACLALTGCEDDSVSIRFEPTVGNEFRFRATIDQQVHDSHTRWKELEERLGIDIEVRTWCFLDSANSGSLDRKLLETLLLVLWPRGWRLQAASLSSWNPFDDAPAPAPALLETLLTGHDPVVVDLTDNGAEVKVADALRSHAAVDVRAPGTERERLASFLASTTVTAVAKTAV